MVYADKDRHLRGEIIKARFGSFWHEIVKRLESGVAEINMVQKDNQAMTVEFANNKPSREFLVHRKIFPAIAVKGRIAACG